MVCVLAVPELDLSNMVEFVNEYADRPREVAGEQWASYPDAAALLDWSSEVPIPPPGDLVATANAIFAVFSSARDGRGLDELNRQLRSVRPVPEVTGSGLRWTVAAPGDVLTAALATCLLTWLVDHDAARLGTCQASRCVDVYADNSPAGRRRFCSSTCLNRHKVSAHRERASRVGRDQ